MKKILILIFLNSLFISNFCLWYEFKKEIEIKNNKNEIKEEKMNENEINLYILLSILIFLFISMFFLRWKRYKDEDD